MKRDKTKDIRKLNEYNFNEYVLEGLQMIYNVRHKPKQGMYIIRTGKYGSVDIYPKADKLMFHDTGRWINGGAEWLCNNL